MSAKQLINNTDRKGMVFFCYYSGHGVLESTTKIILPDEVYKQHRNPFPLESRLRSLKVIEFTYVIGVFDCCRSIFKTPQQVTEHRGAIDQADEEEHEDHNLVLVFGCEPEYVVKAKS